MESNPNNEKTLKELFAMADKIGDRRYNRLTPQDLDDYHKFEHWRYVDSRSECGTTLESKAWVKDHSDYHCPLCEHLFSQRGGKNIDHKLPRSQYPWLSMEFNNLWVICRDCNIEKAEMHWYRYEQYVLLTYPDRYENARSARPIALLRSLADTLINKSET